MKIEYVYENNHEFHAVGRIWIVPKLALTKLPDGSLGMSLAEIDRIHGGIANQICGQPSDLTPEEFEFRCDITGTSFTQVAEAIQVPPSTLTKWRGRGGPLNSIRSTFLKKWFWFKLFGDKLPDQKIGLRLVRNDADLLRYCRDQAVAHEIVENFEERVA